MRKRGELANYGDCRVGKRGEKYAGFIIMQREGESDYKFLRRIITEIILQVNSVMTVSELAKDLEELSGIRMNLPYLLATLIFKDSGITLVGDEISASIASERLSKNVLRAAEAILNQAGGGMEEMAFFSSIRARTIMPLSDITISDSLKRGESIKQKNKKGKVIFYL